MNQQPIPCSVEGCERAHVARGLCAGHYKRLARTGDIGVNAPFATYNATAVHSCAAPDCTKPAISKRHCSMHTGRLYDHGVLEREPVATPGEGWRDVVGYEGLYEVSDIGRIRSAISRAGTHRGRVLRLNKSGRGYQAAELFDANGDGRHLCVHRLAAEAFLGSPPTPAHVVNHRDAIKANNRVANLEWVTPQENVHHAIALGLHPAGRTRTARR